MAELVATPGRVAAGAPGSAAARVAHRRRRVRQLPRAQPLQLELRARITGRKLGRLCAKHCLGLRKFDKRVLVLHGAAALHAGDSRGMLQPRP
eukprot:364741-Chlamydomonas_euryale.AAC.14